MPDDIISIIGKDQVEILAAAEKGAESLLDTIKLLNDQGKLLEKNLGSIGGSGDLAAMNTLLKQAKQNILELKQATTEYSITSIKALQEQEKLEQQRIKTIQLKAKEEELAAKNVVAAQAEVTKSKQEDIIFTHEQEVSTDAFNAAQERLSASFGPLNDAENKSTAAKKENTAATNQQNLTVTERLTKMQLLGKVLFEQKDQLASVTTQLKLNNAEFAKGTLSETEYIVQQAKLTEQQVLLRAEISATTKELKEQSGIAANGTTIFDKFTNMVQRMGLRMIANIVIFQAAIEAYTLFSKRLQDASDRENIVYNSSVKIHQDAAAIYAKEAAEFEGLIARFKDGSSTMQEKQQVVKDLNDKYGDQIGKLKGIADAEKFIEDKSQAFLNALYLRAQGEAALGVISEATAKNIKNAANGGADLLDTFDQIGAGIVAAFSTAAGVTQLYSSAQKKLKDDTDANNAAIKAAKEQYVAFMQQADAIASKNGFDFNNGAANAAKQHDYTLARIKDEQELTKLLGEEEAKRLQAEMQGLRTTYEDESQSLEDRLNAFKNHQSLKLAAQQAGTDAQAEEARIALKKIKQIEDAAAAGGTIQPQEQTLLDRKKVYLQQLRLAVADEQLAEATNTRETQEGIDKIYMQSAKLRIEQLRYITENVIAQEDVAQDALKDKYKNGEISWEDYQKQKKAITDQYAAEAIRQQDLYLTNEINFSNLSDNAIVELKRKLVENLKVLYGIDGKNWEDNEARKVAAKEKANQEIEHLITQTISIAQQAEDQHFQNQLNQQQELLNNLSIENDTRIAYINATIKNEDDRNKALLENQARYALAQKQIQAEENEIKKKQAIADKAAAIAQAIEGGAVAVVNALKIPIYGEALAIAIAAITAGQIAIIASAPLPQYAKGTQSAAGGASIVGEKGKELVIEPSGKMYETPDTASIMNIPKASKIFTNEEYMRAIQNSSIKSLAGMGKPINENTYLAALLEAEERNSRGIIGAIKGQKQTPVYIPVPDYKLEAYIKSKRV